MKWGKPLKHVSGMETFSSPGRNGWWECLWFWFPSPNLLGSPVSFNESLGVVLKKSRWVLDGTPLKLLPTADHTPHCIHEPQMRDRQFLTILPVTTLHPIFVLLSSL